MNNNQNIRQIALVTGATRGIGKAIALLLAKNNIKVIGTATSENGVLEINETLKPFNGEGALLDLNNSESIIKTIEKITELHGAIDILIDNAAITNDKLFLRMSENDWHKVLNVNLNGAFYLSKAVIKNMLTKRFGRIIYLSSVVGFTGNAGQTNYTTSKAALVAFAKSLSLEFASRNITVNCVAPGFIETDMTAKLNETQKEELLKKIPMGRIGTVDDIANTVLFLINSPYITGTTIHVNGGLYMA